MATYIALANSITYNYIVIYRCMDDVYLHFQNENREHKFRNLKPAGMGESIYMKYRYSYYATNAAFIFSLLILPLNSSLHVFSHRPRQFSSFFDNFQFTLI